MNHILFKTKTAIAVSLCAAGVLTTASSASAAMLSGSINIDSSGNPTAVVTPTSVTFGGGVVSEATGDFAPLKDVNFPTVTSLTGLTAPTTPIGPIASFIDFGVVTLKGETNSLVFDLVSGTVTTLNGAGNVLQASVDIFGNFVFGQSNVGTGILTAQRVGASQGWTITLEAQPIPTPALLPGLLGLGVAALRRNQDEIDEENA